MPSGTITYRASRYSQKPGSIVTSLILEVACSSLATDTFAERCVLPEAAHRSLKRFGIKSSIALFSSIKSFSVLLAASQVSAIPTGSSLTVAKRSPGCDGLGSGTIDKLSGFILVADDGNGHTDELILVDSDNKVGEATIAVLATFSTVPSAIFVPTFSLDTGVLTPDGGVEVDLAVAAGDLPGFAATNGEGGHIYCAAPGSTNIPVLAVNGDKDSFYLCLSDDSNPVNLLVYKPDDVHTSYDSTTCKSVDVNVVKQ
ncbi:unnamed protein product [Somion occarium]|uniref:Uncharacterized protein n=1 Tax=Somion occarium TaxID=3059160 RepID=A0ABP1D3A9_9APHY